MGRAPCCDKNNVKKGPWSPEEDSQLKQYIEKYGTGGNWIALPQKVGLKRCGKSCRLRWLNYLRPNIKHGGFSEEEDRIICSLFVAIGSRWSIIAAQLPGRTDNDIKNYWNTKLKKKLLGKRCKESQTSSSSGTRRISSLSSSASASAFAAATKQDQKCNDSNDNIIVPPPPPPPAVEAISISPMYNNSSSSSLEMNMNMNACSSYSAIINHPALLVEQQANSSITSDHSSSSSGPSPFQVTSEEILQSLQDPCSVMQNSPRISNNPEPTFQIPPPFIYSEPSSSSDLPPLLIQSENSPLFSASRPTGPNDMTIKVEDYGFMAACSDFSFYGGGGVPEELGKNTNEIMPNHGYTEISSIFAGAVGPVFLPPADFPQQQFYPYYMSQQQQDIFQDGTIFGLQ